MQLSNEPEKSQKRICYFTSLHDFAVTHFGCGIHNKNYLVSMHTNSHFYIQIFRHDCWTGKTIASPPLLPYCYFPFNLGENVIAYQLVRLMYKPKTPFLSLMPCYSHYLWLGKDILQRKIVKSIFFKTNDTDDMQYTVDQRWRTFTLDKHKY